MQGLIGNTFIEITWLSALAMILLGFIGGVLSGFIGSGGAFFMTPGMMNLGVPGVIAVASNVTHKFGKAMVGARKHAQMGNVDKRLAAFMLLTALIGVQLAVWINSALFQSHAGEGQSKSAAGDLYISGIFIVVLTFVAVSLLRDAMRPSAEGFGPSRRITDYLSRLNLKPIIKLPASDVEVSLWILLLVGLATGYLAGTIGVGGFVGVPAMIYVFGIPTAVAAGTELFLAIFTGAFGALNYAWGGYVDLRLTLLLFLGSLVGVYIGAYGVKVVNERYIRMATGLIIALCVISRAVNIPVYCRELGWARFDPRWDAWLNGISTAVLFISGIGGAVFILCNVAKAHSERRRIHTTLLTSHPLQQTQQGA